MDGDWTQRRPHFRGAAAAWRARAWRWCMRHIQHQARLAAARGRLISPQNLRRMRLRCEAWMKDQDRIMRSHVDG